MGRFISTLILAAIPLVGWGCDRPSRGDSAAAQTQPSSTPSTASKSSSAEKLLLLEDDAPPTATDKPVADNNRCLVCHLNFEQEELTTKHAIVNIGCAQCHGVSDAHIADESWASGGNGTAPDIMFPSAKINAACMACHHTKLDVEKHKSYIAGTNDPKTCTECHGKHRMVNRKCKWR